MSQAANRSLDSLIKFLRDQKRAILLFASVAAVTISLSIIIPALLDTTTHVNFLSVGTIRTIGVKVYYDPNLQNVTTSIRWGVIYLGSSSNVTLYIKSTSNAESVLYLQAANWTFLNSKNAIVSGPNETTPYLTLAWNYNNTVINPAQTIPVTLTLSVADSPSFYQFILNKDVTSFSFDIIISTA